MSDIVERLRFMSYPEAGMAADEIERLRSLLKEAGDSIQRLYHYHRGCHEDEDVMEPSGSDWALAWDQSRTVLSKIKGEA